MADLSQKIRDIINNGLEILENGLGTTLESMLIQLVATIILVLAVRFLFWDKITAILEERKRLVEAGLQAKDDALNEAIRIQEENIILKEDAKKQAKEIIESSKRRSFYEADQIISDAKERADNEVKRAKEAIEIEKRKAEDYISDEIIDTAFLLSQKIIKEEINEEKHRSLISDFINKVEKK